MSAHTGAYKRSWHSPQARRSRAFSVSTRSPCLSPRAAELPVTSATLRPVTSATLRRQLRGGTEFAVLLARPRR
jgi:hypothetical protein